MTKSREYFTRPMQITDLPDTADVAARAFAPVFGDCWSYRLDDPQVFSSFRIWWLNSLRNDIHRIGKHCWVLCKRLDLENSNVSPPTEPRHERQTEQIVGAAIWTRRGSSKTAQAWGQVNTSFYDVVERTSSSLEHQVTVISGGYGTAYDRYMNDTYDQVCGESVVKWNSRIPEAWHLLQMMVDPAHQGKNLASRLLSLGVKCAEDEGVPVTLFASDLGRPFYERRGFFVLDWPNSEKALGPNQQLLPFMGWEPARLNPALPSIREYKITM